jgi:ferric-dicitrate binding protein FerR (iron transport regulator)
MSANSLRLERLFDKYVSDTITNEELIEFWQLMVGITENDRMNKRLETLWNQVDNSYNPAARVNREKIFSRILEKGKEREINFEKLHRRQSWPRIAAAAAIIIFIVTGSYFFFLNGYRPETVFQQRARNGSTAYIRNVTLSDGSTVVLQATSVLDYPGSFTGNTREVTLTGEAYFDIHQDERKPFIIHTGKVKTTVLGTAFNIRADGENITVSVTRGRVRVEDDRKVLAVLAPNQQITYTVRAAIVEQKAVNAMQIATDWTKQDMVFEGASFASIAEVVSKRYGVTIEFKNPELRLCMIVASFSGIETLENVMEILCTIRNASYSIKDNQHIVIDGKGCE